MTLLKGIRAVKRSPAATTDRVCVACRVWTFARVCNSAYACFVRRFWISGCLLVSAAIGCSSDDDGSGSPVVVPSGPIADAARPRSALMAGTEAFPGTRATTIPASSSEAQYTTGCWSTSGVLGRAALERTELGGAENWVSVARLSKPLDGHQLMAGRRPRLSRVPGGELFQIYTLTEGDSLVGALERLDPWGNLTWTRSGLLRPFSVVGLEDGGAIVGGDVAFPGCGSVEGDPANAFVSRFDADGEELWTVTFGNTPSFDRVFELALCGEATVCGTGHFNGVINFPSDVSLSTLGGLDHFAFAVAIGDGTLTWATPIGTKNDEGDAPGVVGTADGSVVAGYTHPQNGYVIRFGSAGERLWETSVDVWMLPADPTIDGLGRLWVPTYWYSASTQYGAKTPSFPVVLLQLDLETGDELGRLNFGPGYTAMMSNAPQGEDTSAAARQFIVRFSREPDDSISIFELVGEDTLVTRDSFPLSGGGSVIQTSPDTLLMGHLFWGETTFGSSENAFDAPDGAFFYLQRTY